MYNLGKTPVEPCFGSHVYLIEFSHNFSMENIENLESVRSIIELIFKTYLTGSIQSQCQDYFILKGGGKKAKVYTRVVHE